MTCFYLRFNHVKITRHLKNMAAAVDVDSESKRLNRKPIVALEGHVPHLIAGYAMGFGKMAAGRTPARCLWRTWQRRIQNVKSVVNRSQLSVNWKIILLRTILKQQAQQFGTAISSGDVAQEQTRA